MSAEPTHCFESREQSVESVRQERDSSGADVSGLDVSGTKFTGLAMGMILDRKRRRA